MQVGLKLATEAFPPKEIVRQTVRAEQAGFDFVELSDHFHPWLDVQGHSSFTWSVLGAMAARTERIGLATGVTCPMIRYHPAVIAQAIATLGAMFPGRFWVALGSGEASNEHITGAAWPRKPVRERRLRECVDVIRALLAGEEVSHNGLITVDHARLWTRPEHLPPLVGFGVRLAVAGR